MAVRARRVAFCNAAHNEVLEEGVFDLVASATGLSQEVGTFIKFLNQNLPPDLLQDTVAQAKRPVFGLGPARGMAFLTRVTWQQALSAAPTVGSADPDSMVYQFQCDNHTSALAVYFHPRMARELVFFWIGTCANAFITPNAQPMLMERGFDWNLLSPSYAKWLVKAHEGN